MIRLAGLASRPRRGVRLAVDRSVPALPGAGSDASSAVIRKLFRRWVSLVRGAVTAKMLESALRKGDAVAIQHAPFWGKSWEEVNGAWQTESLEIMQAAGAESLRSLGFNVSFDLQNPYANDYARAMTATRVVEVGDETKAAIRDVVARGFTEGHAPREQAKELRELVGLTSRDTLAADRRHWNLVADGTSVEDALEMTRRYAVRLLRRRAENIARTETIDSQNAGLQAAWRTADSAGLVDPSARRKWLAATTSDRTCDICRPLHGQYATLDEPYPGGLMRPPAHPSCRCTQGLVTPAPGETLPEPKPLPPLKPKKKDR